MRERALLKFMKRKKNTLMDISILFIVLFELVLHYPGNVFGMFFFRLKVIFFFFFNKN